MNPNDSVVFCHSFSWECSVILSLCKLSMFMVLKYKFILIFEDLRVLFVVAGYVFLKWSFNRKVYDSLSYSWEHQADMPQAVTIYNTECLWVSLWWYIVSLSLTRALWDGLYSMFKSPYCSFIAHKWSPSFLHGQGVVTSFWRIIYLWISHLPHFV